MTAIEFISSAYADARSHEEAPAKITPDEASKIIDEWRNEGIEIPVMVTPVLFSAVWNIYCDK